LLRAKGSGSQPNCSNLTENFYKFNRYRASWVDLHCSSRSCEKNE